MKTSEILIAARKKIEKEENWTQRHHAKNAAGRSVSVTDEYAVSFCSLGAIQKVLNCDLAISRDSSKFKAFRGAKTHLEAFVPGLITNYNDTHTHAEVLELFDRAIASAIAEENQNGAE